MKKIVYIILSVLFACLLASCSESFLEPPQSVTIHSHIYKRTTVEMLYPYCYEKEESEGEKIGWNKYYKINDVQFDYYVCYDRRTAKGCMYFAEDVFEAAMAYYGNLDNYNYYCVFGSPFDETNEQKYLLTDFDRDKFEELLVFAESHAYNPLSSFQEVEGVRQTDMPDPDDWNKHEIYFYRKSKDEDFGTDFYTYVLTENTISLLHCYDFSNEENPQMKIVDIPIHLNNYFLQLIAQLKG